MKIEVSRKYTKFMFSGLIKYLGVVSKPLGSKEGEIGIRGGDIVNFVDLGGSVAVNGACLTLTRKQGDELFFFVSYETVERSTISKLSLNTIVNLELPVNVSTFLDGHIVLGHVDTVGKVEEISKIGDSYKITVSVPKQFMKNIVFKGSVAIDGISLTVYDFNDASKSFSVAVIPYTFENTNMKYLKVGSLVNVEFDIIGKYVERILSFKESNISIDKLRDFLGT